MKNRRKKLGGPAPPKKIVFRSGENYKIKFNFLCWGGKKMLQPKLFGAKMLGVIFLGGVSTLLGNPKLSGHTRTKMG